MDQSPLSSKTSSRSSSDWTRSGPTLLINDLNHGRLNDGIFKEDKIEERDFRRNPRDTQEIATLKFFYKELTDLRILPVGYEETESSLVRLSYGTNDWEQSVAAKIEDQAINRRILYVEIFAATTSDKESPNSDWMTSKRSSHHVRGVFFGFGDEVVYYESIVQCNGLRRVSKTLNFLLTSETVLKISSTMHCIYRDCWRQLLNGAEAMEILTLGEMLDFRREGLPLYRDDFQSLSLCLVGNDVQPIWTALKWEKSTTFFRCDTSKQNMEEAVQTLWNHGSRKNINPRLSRSTILDTSKPAFKTYVTNILNLLKALLLTQIERSMEGRGRDLDIESLEAAEFNLRTPNDLKIQAAQQMKRRYSQIAIQPVESVFYYPGPVEGCNHVMIDLRTGTNRKIREITEELVETEKEAFRKRENTIYRGRAGTGELFLSHFDERTDLIESEDDEEDDE